MAPKSNGKGPHKRYVNISLPIRTYRQLCDFRTLLDAWFNHPNRRLLTEKPIRISLPGAISHAVEKGQDAFGELMERERIRAERLATKLAKANGKE